MTYEQAEELLLNNDWSKFSDARELLLDAARIGAKDERKRVDTELRRLYDQRDALLKALKTALPQLVGKPAQLARAAIAAVEED